MSLAESLTRDDIPCPSAQDRARNRHRAGVAWSKSAIRVILTNPRYTGRQTWNKQRTDEVLLDVNDVALGHTAVMRWNDRDRWVTSKDLVHEPLVDQTDFEAVQTMLTRRARTGTAPKRPHRSRHPYIFKSLIFCGVCQRKMQARHSHGVAYYRCRYPQEYALANKVDHPRNVIMREEVLIQPLDTWLAQQFGPLHRRHTITKLIDQATVGMPTPASKPQGPTTAELDAKLTRYRAALDAGADPAVVAGWIAETQAEREHINQRHNVPTPVDELSSLSEDQIIAIGLRLTYEPETRTVQAKIDLGLHRWDSVCVRGGT
ncbi:recombinase family protein [Plantactinospora sp. S1510]|uniref:Recombinase family protein n=1 Tax=Plantactinospora alkalitolerans TaxID=2789879 RepID=A0ABS0GVU0_9ACTN|nr:recombinase family protein [Plantactinospora alkalitolerans]MBF9130118.1 recombinase family protein [Plantactinospora alkalitolerans]